MTYDKLCTEPVCLVNDLVCYVKSNKHSAYRLIFVAYKQTAVVKIHSGINGCKFLKIFKYIFNCSHQSISLSFFAITA